jgi:hypothetical protein
LVITKIELRRFVSGTAERSLAVGAERLVSLDETERLETPGATAGHI